MNSSVHQNATQVVIQYMEAFFKFFDTETERQSLLDAYHDKALLSVSADYPRCYSGKSSAPLNNWFSMGRNCDRMEYTRLKHQLKRGKLNCVACLNGMPRTKHEFSSFTMDVTHASEQMISFTLTGLFREFLKGEKEEHFVTRYFARTCILVPLNQGWVMMNDMWHVTNGTSFQHRQMQAATAPTTTPTTTTGVTPNPVAAPAVVPVAAAAAPPTVNGQPSMEIKKAMVEQFSNQSGMNHIFSQRLVQF